MPLEKLTFRNLLGSSTALAARHDGRDAFFIGERVGYASASSCLFQTTLTDEKLTFSFLQVCIQASGADKERGASLGALRVNFAYTRKFRVDCFLKYLVPTFRVDFHIGVRGSLFWKLSPTLSTATENAK